MPHLALLNEIDGFLWRNCEQKKQELVKKMLPWVNKITASFYKKYRASSMLEFGDYMHVALIGLYRALELYEPAKGNFFAYAFQHMRGEVLSMITKNKEHGQPLQIKERLSDIKSLSEGSEEKLCHYVSLGALLEPQYISGIEYNDGEISILRNNITKLVNRLADDKKDVIIYHYFYSIAFKDIASILELSAARISQLHKESLCEIRNLLTQGN